VFNPQYIYKKKNVWSVIPLFKSRFFLKILRYNSLFITRGTQAEESLSHRIIVSTVYEGVLFPAINLDAGLSLCTLFVGTDTYVLATTTRKTSKAIFSTARATGTWCIPAFYILINDHAKGVPRSDTSK
jgi:hypothetical protein